METKAVRIMKHTNIAETNVFVNNIKQTGSPVTVIKLSPTPKGVFFYNSLTGSTFVTSPGSNVNFNIDSNVIMSIRNIKSKNTGTFDVHDTIKWLFLAEEVDSHGEQKSLCEAILYDENDLRAITIWENLLEEISEETMYLFQNIFLKDFYGLKLTKTTRATIISSEGPVSFTLPEDVVTNYMELNYQLKNHLDPKICCLEVVSVVTLDVFPGCTNITCGKPVVVIPDHPSTSCQQRNTTMKVSKCPCVWTWESC